MDAAEGPDGSSAQSTSEPPDEVLIALVRQGDSEAYGALYERHRMAALNLARQMSRDSAEADDLVSDAFLKVRSVLDAGGGPDVAFRAYLLTTVRRLAYDRTRSGRRVVSTSDYAGMDTAVPFEDTAAAQLEASLVTDAYESLPERWKLVLWHRVVQGESTEQVARRMGTTPNAVAALLYRAREGLRAAYLQAHITDRPEDGACDWTIERLAAYARGGLPRRESARVTEHLAGCARCRALRDEVRDVNATFKAAMAPAVVASGAALLTTSSAAAGGATHAGSAAGGAAAGKLAFLGLILGGALTVAIGGTIYVLTEDAPAPGAQFEATHAVLTTEQLSRLATTCFTSAEGTRRGGSTGAAPSDDLPAQLAPDTPVTLGPDATRVAVVVDDGSSTIVVDVTSARLAGGPCVVVSGPEGAGFLAFGSEVERPWECGAPGVTMLCRPQGQWWQSADPDPAEEADVWLSTRISDTDGRRAMVYVVNATENGFSVEPVAT